MIGITSLMGTAVNGIIEIDHIIIIILFAIIIDHLSGRHDHEYIIVRKISLQQLGDADGFLHIFGRQQTFIPVLLVPLILFFAQFLFSSVSKSSVQCDAETSKCFVLYLYIRQQLIFTEAAICFGCILPQKGKHITVCQADAAFFDLY